MCVLCREMERETEGEREAGVCSVCIMQRDGERERERETEGDREAENRSVVVRGREWGEWTTKGQLMEIFGSGG